MSQYFDKDFWKFFIGFVAIIVISLVIISATRSEQSRKVLEPRDSFAKTK